MTTAAAEARQAAQTHELVLARLVGQLQHSTTTLSQLPAASVVSAPDPAHASAPVLRASADSRNLGCEPLSAMMGRP